MYLAIGRMLDNRAPVANLPRQMFIGKHDFCIENVSRLVFRFGDNYTGEISIEQRHIESDQIDQRGEPELSRFQNDVVIPQIVQKKTLRRAEMERRFSSLFIDDHIEVVQSPKWIRENAIQFFNRGTHCIKLRSKMDLTSSETEFSTSTLSL